MSFLPGQLLEFGLNTMKTKNKGKKVEQDKQSPYSFDEVYKAITQVLVKGTEEQQKKALKVLNEGKGDWVWLKAKLITETYSFADAKGKEEFALIGMQKHLDSGSAVLLNEVFTDPETSIRYRQYKFKKRPIYRIPFATEEMDKYAYDKAINKKFLGDFIEMDVPADNKVIMIPLDTPEKVKDYNGGDYFKKHRFPGTAKKG